MDHIVHERSRTKSASMESSNSGRPVKRRATEVTVTKTTSEVDTQHPAVKDHSVFNLAKSKHSTCKSAPLSAFTDGYSRGVRPALIDDIIAGAASNLSQSEDTSILIARQVLS